MSTPSNSQRNSIRPLPRRWKTVLALALVAAISVLVFLHHRSVTIGTVLTQYGYSEFRPPSRLFAPGHWVHVTQENPLHLSNICGSMKALGFPDDFEPSDSPTISTELSRSLDVNFDLTADLISEIRANPSFQVVDRITFSLDNVRLVEVADDQVRKAILNRDPDCHAAIKARFDSNDIVTMIKSALIANVQYEVHFRSNLDATAETTVLRELALDFDLRTRVDQTSKQTLLGSELVWGVREDASLAAVGIGLVATGGTDTTDHRRVLQDLGPIRKLEAPTADAPASDAGRRRFADSEVIVRHDVEPKRQSSENACWATVYAMMTAWRTGRPAAVTDVVRTLGEPYSNYYVSDQGLPGGQELAFVEAARMIALPPANYTMTAFADHLREYGPLWIIAGDGISSHARLLVGVYGEAIVEELQAYRSTVFEFIDPSTGTYIYESALDFMYAFEREAAYVVERDDTTDLRWQILHWPS